MITFYIFTSISMHLSVAVSIRFFFYLSPSLLPSLYIYILILIRYLDLAISTTLFTCRLSTALPHLIYIPWSLSL